ncbi:X2-like carbohydrate binding domain-containing protein [Clostridium felsineum]|uniref:X2-like carbohydrate binding domain-containing protein n=1 Tax=Clostridium felsineum TaxID=36839 RepID=UPI00098CE596|nr:X2-like carbohydrate binding domain-containing protein [Clostridium felsineum]URZ01446.1 hypothetical protein CLAUR_014410 [Clostridium felsineum]
MKKRNIAILGMFMMTASLGISKNHVFADTVKASNSGVQVQLAETNTNATSNTIASKFKVTNNTGAPLDLTTLKLRYYFTSDGTQAQNFWCDYAAIEGANYKTITSNVVGNFVAMDNPTKTADHYLEISFSSGTGQLDAGSSIEIQSRVAKNDWSNYDQSNDYSFNANATNYTDWSNVTAYSNGSLVYGNPPVVDPVIDPTSATFDVANPSDVNVALQLNEFTLNGLTDENGQTIDPSNYTISGSNLVLSKAYLQKEAIGKHTVNFAFTKGTATVNKSLALTVEDTAGIVVKPTTVSFDKAAPADQSVALTLNGHALGDVVGPKGTLVKGTDYTLADDGTVTLSKAYLATLPLGNSTLTFKAADDPSKAATVTVTVKNANATSITVGDVTGAKKGDTVKVPVTISTVKTPVGLLCMDINYDPKELNVKDVLPTDLIKGVDTNSFIVNTTTPGKISITFQDPTLGSDPISAEGIIAYLEFIVAGEKAGKFDLKVNPTTVILADENDSDIDCNPPKDGSVSVIGDPIVTPTQITFEQDSATAQNVTVDANGNTFKDVVEEDASGKVINTLKQGTDYTVTDTGITLSQAYLSTLSVGTHNLVLEFTAADGTIKTQAISVVVTKNTTLTISVANVAGKTGDTVKVPVTIKNVTTPLGLLCAEIDYDATKFTVKDVLANTDLIKDSNVNFIVNTSTPGKITITFQDSTLGNDPISADGILAYLEFLINEDAATGVSPVTISTDPTKLIVADENDADIKDKSSNGSIEVTQAPLADPVVNTTQVNYDKSAPADQTVSVTFNKDTVKDVKNGDTVIPTSAYTVTSDGVVLSKDYLATLANGTYTFTIDFNRGSSATFTVVVSGIATSVVNTGSVTYSQASPADQNISISFYGNTIVDVKDAQGNVLKAGSDYTVTDAGIVLSKAYLATLAEGTYAFTIDFSQGKAGSFNVVVKGIVNSTVTTGSVTYDQNVPAAQNINIAFNGNTIVDVKDAKGNVLKQGTDYTITDAGIVLSKDYLATLAAGTYAFTIDFSEGQAGTFNVVVKPLTILNLTVGNATGNPGDTVRVPVTINTVTTPVGLVCMEISYDASKFTVKDVLPADLIKDSGVNFIVNTSTSGKISITFQDSTLGSDAISADGIFAYLDFLINSGVAAGDSAITVNPDPTKLIVADENDTDIKDAYKNGTITVTGTPVVTKDSTVTTGSVTYDQNAPAAQDVAITFNGNTVVDVKDASGNVLKAGTDYTVTSTGITLSQGYLATLAAGTYTYTVDFSSGKAGSFTVVVKAANTPVSDKTTIVVGTVTGKAGDTVRVPVTISKVTTPLGLVSVEVSYDASKFTVKDVLPADLIKDSSANFEVNTKVPGKIKITFNDSTLGSEGISADGIFAYLDFLINSGAVQGDSVLKGNSVVADENDADVASSFTNGTITVQAATPVVQDSVVTTGSVTYDQNAPAAQDVAITLNGNTVSDVKDASGNVLKAGTDYTVTSTGITLSQSYLSTLAAGTYTYTVDFSAGKAGSFTVVVKPVVVATKTVLTVGTATGKAGDTVKVPVTISKVTTPVGLVCMEINYDASKFTVKDVLPNADVIKDSSVNFIVNTSTAGKISITFQDSTLGKDAISADGIFAYLDFLINSGAASGDSAITVNSDPTKLIVADENDADVASSFANGTITVQAAAPVVQDSAVTTGSVTYDQNAPAAQDVAITLNGNTVSDVKDASGNVLKAGTDYTVTSAGITLSQSYLSTLAAGTYTYAIDFSAGKAGSFTVVVKPVNTPTPVSNKTTLAVGTAQGKAGDTVRVPVTISKVATPAGLICMEISYDTSKFTVKDVLANTDLVKQSSISFIANTSTAGKISITFQDPTLGSDPINADGVFAYLDFTINSGAAAGDSALTVNPSSTSFVVADENDTDIASTFSNGTITVE